MHISLIKLPTVVAPRATVSPFVGVPPAAALLNRIAIKPFPVGLETRQIIGEYLLEQGGRNPENQEHVAAAVVLALAYNNPALTLPGFDH